MFAINGNLGGQEKRKKMYACPILKMFVPEYVCVVVGGTECQDGNVRRGGGGGDGGREKKTSEIRKIVTVGNWERGLDWVLTIVVEL